MAFIEIPKVDSLLEDLTDEQIVVMVKKAMDEFKGIRSIRRDFNRFVELIATQAACAREADRRGGAVREWLLNKFTEDLPSGKKHLDSEKE